MTSMRLLFGHQSVGANLLDGLRELDRGGAACPRLVDADTGGALPASGPFLAHFRVGRNGAPDSKIRAFAERVEGAGAGHQVDVALFKFCYVDVTDAAAARGLFDDYARAMETLQARFPRTLIGHVTVPLRTSPTPLRAVARLVLGRGAHPEVARNAARHAFNRRLIETFGARGAVFDLAGIEAGGTARGESPKLLTEYSNDGGHLNANGRAAVAKAFLRYFDSLALKAAA